MMERKAYTAFGKTGFGETGFGKTGGHPFNTMLVISRFQGRIILQTLAFNGY